MKNWHFKFNSITSGDGITRNTLIFIIQLKRQLRPVTEISEFIDKENILKTREESGYDQLISNDFNETSTSWYQKDTKHFIEIKTKYCR